MKHKRWIILFTLLSTVLLSGCWDRVELKDLGIISAIGIDKGGDNVKNRYRATIQIVNTAQVAGGQQGGKVQASPVTTYTATGSTLSEALRKISPQTSGELFFPHVEVLIIGEGMAKEGIQELFDVIERDSQFRVLFSVLIARDHTAESVLKVTTPLAAIPSAEIMGALESSRKEWGEYAKTRADQIIEGLGKGGLAITGVRITGKVKEGNKTTNTQQISPGAKIEISGLALFKDGKLKKWLNGEAARGLTWIKDEMQKTVINLDCKEKKDAIAIEIVRSKSDIRVKMKHQKPVIYINVYTEGTALETNCSMDFGEQKVIEKLEEQLDKEIKEEVMAAVKAGQKQKSDMFGFGEYVNMEDKRFWKKNENKWENEIFPETEVHVNVRAFIRRTGMRTKSYIE